jgi:beta-lactamase class C
MCKRIFTRAIIFTLIIFSTFNLGSITDISNNPERLAFINENKPDGLDSIIFAYDDYMQRVVDNFKTPGAAIAMVYKGEVLLLKGYGVKYAGGYDSVDLHTAFRIGSVSKGFASVLTGILVEEGYLNWDDKVKEHLPDFHMKDTFNAAHLTVRHILSQTSGYPSHTYTDLLDNGYAYERIKPSLSSVPSVAKPGQIYSYQNVVYSLIGDILQESTGKNYSYLLQEKIFGPLNMNEASSDFTSFNNNPNSAMPHLRYGNSWKAKPKNDRYYSVSPASGINASASDMAQWLLALTGYYPEVINKDVLAEISKICIETPKKSMYRKNWKSLEKTYYGLGWRIFKTNGHNIVYHGGYVEGFRTEIAFDPETKIGIAIMFNSNTPIASLSIPYFFDMIPDRLIQGDKSDMLAYNLQ